MKEQILTSISPEERLALAIDLLIEARVDNSSLSTLDLRYERLVSAIKDVWRSDETYGEDVSTHLG